jgi:hypothetical protein
MRLGNQGVAFKETDDPECAVYALYSLMGL